MVGTRKLARLRTHAETAGAKVVLVGDPCQLPEIEAGGTFRGLHQRLGASHLVDNRRQREQWARATLTELRAGDPARALDAYTGHARAHKAASDDPARHRPDNHWMTARLGAEAGRVVDARLPDHP